MPRRYYDPNTIEFSFVDTLHTRKRPPAVKFPLYPIWTKNKAKLIQKYCLHFVLVAKHGTYIDGFAGPQQAESPDMWSAKLVLENQPKWFRNFYLFDSAKRQVTKLQKLKDAQPPPDRTRSEPKRQICIKHGDCNRLIVDLLKSKKINQKEATFCLLDQWTFECEWATLEALSAYKSDGPKIEILYFLPNAWLNRAIAAQKDKKKIERWWGRKDWPMLKATPPAERVRMFVERFKKELGYWSAEPWPIFKDNSRNVVMYFMIHATDHPAAPYLMQRAYKKAIEPEESVADVQIEIDDYLALVDSRPPRRLRLVR